MTSPYPARQPKRLERSKSNRVLGGVCAGVANYLNMDPTLVRVLTVLLTLFTGVPVVVYLVLLLVVPEEGSPTAPPSYPPVGQAEAQQGCRPGLGSDRRAVGAAAASRNSACADSARAGAEVD